MEFSQLFSILAVVGAVLFFTAGFSFGLLNGRRGLAAASVEDEAFAGERQAEVEQLRTELAACREALKGAEAQHGNTAAALQRAAALDAECNRLRAEVQTSTTEVARLKSTLADVEHRANHAANVLPPAALDATTGLMTFQGILGRLGKTKGMRAAVLGDGLGLPVAALGEQSESLAGFCGFISQAAGKARDFLQLGRIRRIVIEDERLATLTACSIAESDLFLATLTSGPGPDLTRMVQVLNDVKSFMSQRSRA